jgi:uncharacterized protein YbjT (DUF2867 family)
MTQRHALILGATGSVGQALLAEVIRSAAFDRIVVIVRKSLATPWPAQVEERRVPDMTPQKLRQAVEAALRTLDGDVLGFSVLGVGARTAQLTLDEHRAVDVELNAAFAQGLHACGKVKHLAFMSAIGANIQAKTTGSGAAGLARYSRVKGEAEAAVQNQGLSVVSIFRPALILGSQHTPALLSAVVPLFARLTPANFRSIRTTEIAQAMVAATLNPAARSAVFNYPEMMALIANSSSNPP